MKTKFFYKETGNFPERAFEEIEIEINKFLSNSPNIVIHSIDHSTSSETTEGHFIVSAMVLYS
ncbi:MAG TPA: hypothetical protein DCG69_12460 [Bacteroidales bacterium]|nr:hypothetical protein [Bacteroidales bacterium]